MGPCCLLTFWEQTHLCDVRAGTIDCSPRTVYWASVVYISRVSKLSSSNLVATASHRKHKMRKPEHVCSHACRTQMFGYCLLASVSALVLGSSRLKVTQGSPFFQGCVGSGRWRQLQHPENLLSSVIRLASPSSWQHPPPFCVWVRNRGEQALAGLRALFI